MNSHHQDHEPPLDERLARESSFHNEKYTGRDLYPAHYAVNPTEHVYKQMKSMLGDISGKRVLEYGCGDGWITADLARMGAHVFAFDVSSQAIDNAQLALSREGLAERCSLQIMPAERLVYSDSDFDVAVGFAILHHLEMKSALAELARVLKPGGIALFAEPLGTNPALQLYRRLTPQYRTEDERPLVLAELPEQLAAFSSFSHREYFLSALGAVGLTYLPGGTRLYPSVSSVLHKIDGALLAAFPALGNWAWYTILAITR